MKFTGLLEKFPNVCSSDEDQLRESIREIAGWVRWNEAVTGRLAIPLEIYERMKKALEDAK